jgi:hypothetical protein
MEGKVPTPAGTIDLYINTSEIRVKSPSGKGILKIESKSRPVCGKEPVVHVNGNSYEISINAGHEYVIKYQAVEK